ncbi:MAG: hypothetical protein ACI9JY_002708, partial [Saprospiraceae bacterium]
LEGKKWLYNQFLPSNSLRYRYLLFYEKSRLKIC